MMGRWRLAPSPSPMNDAERRKRIAEALLAEADEPLRWWFITFTNATTGFLGGAIVQARGFANACRETHRLNINPGGWAIGGPLPESWNHPDFVNRLLTREEAKNVPHSPTEEGPHVRPS